MTSDLICILGEHSTLGENNYRIIYPEQAPMGTHSLSTKNWGGGQLQEEVLKYPMQAPAHPGYEVSCQGLLNQLASLPVLCYLTSSVVHGESCGTFFCKY